MGVAQRGRETEIPDSDLVHRRVDEDVVALDVAVNYRQRLLIVQVLEPFQNLATPVLNNLQSRLPNSPQVSAMKQEELER